MLTANSRTWYIIGIIDNRVIKYRFISYTNQNDWADRQLSHSFVIFNNNHTNQYYNSTIIQHHSITFLYTQN